MEGSADYGGILKADSKQTGQQRNADRILGLRWKNVDLEKGFFSVMEQLPFQVPPKTERIDEMVPTKRKEYPQTSDSFCGIWKCRTSAFMIRHTAATNMHQLTGDFYTVGEILGHTLKGIGISFGISTNLEAVTEQYVDVRLERKQVVLEVYHNALHSRKKTE